MLKPGFPGRGVSWTCCFGAVFSLLVLVLFLVACSTPPRRSSDHSSHLQRTPFAAGAGAGVESGSEEGGSSAGVRRGSLPATNVVGEINPAPTEPRAVAAIDPFVRLQTNSQGG